MADRYFTQESFDFLSKLAANNNGQWFEANKQAYETTVRNPALAFITDVGNELSLISPHFLALPKKVGGSLMRIHRDTRFSKDKRPYKLNIGIHFRHEIGKDVHAPGYYVHIEPGNCFAGVGIWRPDANALGKIRDAIVAKEAAWLAARDDQQFNKHFSYDGEVLVNPPRGYSKLHPLIDDLKRKDFIAAAPLSEKVIVSKQFLSQVLAHFAQATPYMNFLCKALALRF